MTLDFVKLMRILLAIQEVEKTIHGGANKKRKALEIIKSGVTAAADIDAQAEAKIGKVIDAVVEVQNALDGR